MNKSALARQYECCWRTIDRRLNPNKYKTYSKKIMDIKVKCYSEKICYI